MRLRGVAGAMLALALVGAGCNSKLLRPPVTIFADSGGRQIGVTVADIDHRYNAVMFSYFPSRIALHPGDAVNVDVRDTGEPHTVAFGTLVDDAAQAIAELGPSGDPAAAEALPEMRRIPSVLPAVTEGTSPRVNASAAERCFLESGTPPVSPTGGARPCPEADQPDFDGTQAFYSSGFLEEGEPFRMKLSGETTPGTYAFMCLVHRSQMMGAIEVRTTTAERPPVADVREAARAEENEVASTLEPAARRAAENDSGAVLAGAGPEGRIRGLLASFVPETTRARTGERVRWDLFGMHSISFDPAREAQEGVLIEDGDGVRLNLDAWKAVGADPPPAATSGSARAAEIAVDGGSWDGDEPISSGVLRSTPPAAVTYSLAFTEPGTYSYRCLVHQRMRGRVVVEDG